MSDYSTWNNERVIELPLDRLEASGCNPRMRFDEEELRELADSIRLHGVIEPIIAREVLNRDGRRTVTIICGERRWRAARLAGLETIPSRIVDANDEQAQTLALVENLMRWDLDPIEEAYGLRALLRFGMTQDALAETVGRSQEYVANRIRLLTLPSAVREDVIEGRYTASHARAMVPLVGYRDGSKIEQARQLALGGATVREIEQKARELTVPTTCADELEIRLDPPTPITAPDSEEAEQTQTVTVLVAGKEIECQMTVPPEVCMTEPPGDENEDIPTRGILARALRMAASDHEFDAEEYISAARGQMDAERANYDMLSNSIARGDVIRSFGQEPMMVVSVAASAGIVRCVPAGTSVDEAIRVRVRTIGFGELNATWERVESMVF